MEAAGPSTHSTTRDPQLSPKKTPKKNRHAKFKQNNNNSSPKRYQNEPSSSNSYPQNDLTTTSIRSQTVPSTSNSPRVGDPIPRCVSSNKPFASAIVTQKNKPTSQENAKVSEHRATVDSLKITVSNNGSPSQRIVQNNVIQPQKVLQNSVIQPQRVLQNNIIQPQGVIPNNVIQPQIVLQNNVIQPQRVIPNSVIQPPRVLHNNVINSQGVIPNSVIQPQGVIPNTVIRPQGVIPNSVIQPQGVIPNNVIQPQIVLQNNVIQPQGVIPNSAIQPPRVLHNNVINSQGVIPNSVIQPQGVIPNSGIRPQGVIPNSVIQPQGVIPNSVIQPQGVIPNSVIQPQGIIPNNVIQPPRTLQNNVIQPPRTLQNNVIQSEAVFVNNAIHFQRVLQNNAMQPQSVFSNDIMSPQIMVQNDTTQPQGTMPNDATSPRPFQFRFPQARPFRYDTPNQRRSVYNKSAPPNARAPLGPKKEPAPQRPKKEAVQEPNMEPGVEQVNGETSNQKQQQRPNWRQRKHEEEEQDFKKKVIVTGFPAYTKPEELVRNLSSLGATNIEVCKNRVAVIVFGSCEEAATAVKAHDTIPVYGTILSIYKYTNRKHVQELVRANRKVLKNEQKGPPVPSPEEIDLSGDFTQQMQNIEDAIRLTQEEVRNINLLFQDIEQYMRMIFPTCEAVPFGSITTGLGIKSSDADCFLSLRPGAGSRPGAGAAEHCSQFVNRAARLLRLYPHVFADLVAIPRANTPIIKFLHVPTNVNCDLNSKTPLGVQNSRLIGHLLRRDPRFGSVALVLKYWARVQLLSGTGRLTNYALLLLLIFYLQRTLLPPVYKLQDEAHSYKVEIWEAGFDSSPLPSLREVPPLRDLLGGFFLYYAGFDFNELAVCPLVGRPIRKSELESGVLPPQYALYAHNVAARLALPVRVSCPLCVQDPFELSHNVASPVTARLAAEIQAQIKLAATAYTVEEKRPGDFIRSILVRPPPPAPAPGAKLSLPARLLHDLDENWHQVARDTILYDIFRDMLFVELTRRDSVSKDADVETEVYTGHLTRPIWRRGNSHGQGPAAGAMLRWHRAATARVCQQPAIADVNVLFQVELRFRSMPDRGLSITLVEMSGGDESAFRSFRQFAHAFIHRWHRDIFKPHLKQDPTKEDKPANKEKPGPPKKTSPKKARKPRERADRKPKESDAPVESAAFVNSNHKDLSESVAAISLVDGSSQNSKSDCDEAT